MEERDGCLQIAGCGDARRRVKNSYGMINGVRLQRTSTLPVETCWGAQWKEAGGACSMTDSRYCVVIGA